MPQTSNLENDDPQTITPAANYSHAIRHTFAADPLQHLHHEVSDELVRRLSDPPTHANPDLGSATGLQLQQLLDDAFAQMATILSTVRTTCDKMRAEYDALVKQVGFDEKVGKVKNYDNTEDISNEELQEWDYKEMTDKRNQDWTYEEAMGKTPEPPSHDDDDDGEMVYKMEKELDPEEDGPVQWPDVWYAEDSVI